MILGQGLRIITTLLGGGVSNDGIDKVDNGGGGSPMQVCNLYCAFEGECILNIENGVFFGLL